MSLSPEHRQRLRKLYATIKEGTELVLGYPVATDFDCEDLLPFLKFPLNNIGDPFGASSWKVSSHEFECEVVAFFAGLLRAKPDEWWGYVTNGGTEGNLYGLYLAREMLPKGIVYYSQDSHYSVPKNLHFLGMRSIVIRSHKNGEIDYDDLCETIKIHRDLPPIIFANIGTTMTEGRDDIARIHQMLKNLAVPQYYVHVDAALSGMICPFLNPRPAFDFADGADSVSISGHKFLGSPIPCGIVLAHKLHVDRVAKGVAYIGTLDTTITGSRNGFTPLVLWHRLMSLGHEGLRARVEFSLNTAAYAEKSLRAVGIEAWRNPDCITVIFPSVAEVLREKHQLATANGVSHIICMPNITPAHIDQFIKDYQSISDSPNSLPL